MADDSPPLIDSQVEADTEDTTLTPLTFIPPSIHPEGLLSGQTYAHYSPIPPSLLSTEPGKPGPPCCLGVDEAGRGPVLGPMVYGIFYLPIEMSDPLLREAHHFDDSKVLTAGFRAELMQKLCTPESPVSAGNTPQAGSLYDNCGWATSLLSARSISAAMQRPVPYNLNAQAMDTTIALITEVMARGVNVKEIFVDTIGPPATYQARLARIFPTATVVVAKKADSLYPCVSAASVCAKVTRDVALEVLYEDYVKPAQVPALRSEDTAMTAASTTTDTEAGWGSGYPSDARCTTWLKRNMDPLFGWGPECRFSWGTAKELLENKGMAARVQWPDPRDEEGGRLDDYFGAAEKKEDELAGWFGTTATVDAF
jgi:ribonuclease H